MRKIKHLLQWLRKKFELTTENLYTKNWASKNTMTERNHEHYFIASFEKTEKLLPNFCQVQNYLLRYTIFDEKSHIRIGQL